MTEARSIFDDAGEAAALVAKAAWPRLLHSWLYVPVGILIVLLACFGVDSLIGLSSVSFPASVACMIVLFFALIISEALLGEKRTKAAVRLLNIPCDFSLRWISIYFTPSFVVLPLSEGISGVEVGKVIAVFLIGYIAVLAFTAFFVRGLQILLGTSKRAMTERAEELGASNDNIPLTHVQPESQRPSEPNSNATSVSNLSSVPSPGQAELVALQAPGRAQDPSTITGTGGPPEVPPPTAAVASTASLLRQAPIPLTRGEKWAAFVNNNLDTIIYSLIFVFIGIPIYYTTGYAAPVQLSLNIVAYFAALKLPPKWKRFLHPVIVSAFITVMIIWVLALCRHDTLEDGLHAYQTKTRYLQLFRGEGPSLPPPGAGDFLSSVLDVSIVALAMPMYQYRLELKRNFFQIIIPNITLAVASLFGYPAVCHAVGIAPSRSLSFASRSLTLALAQPATENLGGDMGTVAAICIMSGILGVFFGPAMLRYMHIPEDDYITRGVTLGANSSAIGTALLLATDPRAAAFSSLSMSLFGTMIVALTSVPPIVTVVKGLAGA